jgi:hypothetical protein
MKKAHSVTLMDGQDGLYRNPIALAREWNELLKKYPSQRALARDMGVGRHRVADVLCLLSLQTSIQDFLLKLGDPIKGPIITVHNLRPIATGSKAKQKQAIDTLFTSKGVDVVALAESKLPPVRRAKQRENPVLLAKLWQSEIISGKYQSKSDLARQLGLKPSRVTQIMSVLRLSPQVIEIVAGLGDGIPFRVVNETSLRSLIGLTPEDQIQKLEILLNSAGVYPIALKRRRS